MTPDEVVGREEARAIAALSRQVSGPKYYEFLLENDGFCTKQ